MRKYSQVIQRYYVQYLSGYDAVALKQALQGLQHLSDNDSVILSSVCQTISDVSVDQGGSNSIGILGPKNSRNIGPKTARSAI